MRYNVKNKFILFIIIMLTFTGCSSYQNRTETIEKNATIEQQAKYLQKNPLAKGSVVDKNNRAFGTQPSPKKGVSIRIGGIQNRNNRF